MKIINNNTPNINIYMYTTTIRFKRFTILKTISIFLHILIYTPYMY